MKTKVFVFIAICLLFHFALAQENFTEENFTDIGFGVCGDGICDSTIGETQETCPVDCASQNKSLQESKTQQAPAPQETKKTFSFSQNLFIVFLILISLIVILLLITRKKRKVKEPYMYTEK